jgi:hypothetical protein
MTMKQLPVAALVLALVAGCDQLVGQLGPSSTVVRLVNDGTFTVDVTLYISDDQETVEALLVETGTKLEYTVPAGDTATFSRDCEDLQAIVIENAELVVIGELGPEANSEVLRDGSDFDCGDTIVFEFTHSDVLVDFDVSSSIQQGGN